jgi:hypothetical protein
MSDHEMSFDASWFQRRQVDRQTTPSIRNQTGFGGKQ